MNKKILIIILTFVLITTGTYYKPITAHATITSAGIGTYTAGKVILALLAMAGVATEVSDIQSIWQGGQFNSDAYINNVMIFNRDLGLALKAMIASAGSGATTLSIDRTMWNAWKKYCEQEYGTTAGTTTSIGTVQNEVKVWGRGSSFTYGYKVTGGVNGSGSVTIVNNTYDFIVFAYALYTSTYPWRYYLYYVPTEKVENGNTLYNSFHSTTTGMNISAGTGSLYLSQAAGNAMQFSYGLNESFNLSQFVIPAGVYVIPATVSDVTSYINQRILTYRQNGTLTQENIVDAFPVEGVGDEAATAAGQDVIGFANTATQEEGEDVVIEGPLDVALPASAEMEDLLKQLAEQQITYQEFVQALALQAVDTKTETKAQVEAKQQAITVNPSNGVYTVSLDDLFPFCIPFDLYDMLNCLKAEPEAPEVEISLPIGYDGSNFTWQAYTISLEAFDTVAQVGRIFWYILFCIGLMLLTRKLIEG